MHEPLCRWPACSRQHLMRPDMWSDQVAYAGGRRHYASIHRDVYVDVWLICWSPGGAAAGRRPSCHWLTPLRLRDLDRRRYASGGACTLADFLIVP